MPTLLGSASCMPSLEWENTGDTTRPVGSSTASLWWESAWWMASTVVLSCGMRVTAAYWSHSEALNLDLWWVDGELRFWDPVADRWLLSQEEERDGRLVAETRASEEQAARLTAESRVAELEAELRRLRG